MASSSLACVIVVSAACASRQSGEGATQGQPPPQSAAANASPAANGAATRAGEKIYRGSLGERGFEMRLAREGDRVSGSYAYDGIGQELRLDGRADAKGSFELAETDGAGKATGKWSCEGGKPDGSELTCKWAKPDGKGEMFVSLEEQAAFASGLRVVPKTVENRKFGVRASYPQLTPTGGGKLSPAAEHFNELVEKKVKGAADGFAEGMEGEKNLYFNASYNVLLATDDLLSVEISYDSFAGGAHPNSSFDAVTYDLRADRELKAEDVFKPGSGYEKAISRYAVKDINRRAASMEAETAKQEKRKPAPQSEPSVSADQLEEISGFAMTPRGLMIYYDLPHVIAVFDRNFVPYAEVKNFIKPGSISARLAAANP